MGGGRGIPTGLPSPTAQVTNISAAQQAFIKLLLCVRICVNRDVNMMWSPPLRSSHGSWGNRYASATSKKRLCVPVWAPFSLLGTWHGAGHTAFLPQTFAGKHLRTQNATPPPWLSLINLALRLWASLSPHPLPSLPENTSR